MYVQCVYFSQQHESSPCAWTVVRIGSQLLNFYTVLFLELLPFDTFLKAVLVRVMTTRLLGSFTEYLDVY